VLVAPLNLPKGVADEWLRIRGDVEDRIRRREKKRRRNNAMSSEQLHKPTDAEWERGSRLILRQLCLNDARRLIAKFPTIEGGNEGALTDRLMDWTLGQPGFKHT